MFFWNGNYTFFLIVQSNKWNYINKAQSEILQDARKLNNLQYTTNIYNLKCLNKEYKPSVQDLPNSKKSVLILRMIL